MQVMSMGGTQKFHACVRRKLTPKCQRFGMRVKYTDSVMGDGTALCQIKREVCAMNTSANNEPIDHFDLFNISKLVEYSTTGLVSYNPAW